MASGITYRELREALRRLGLADDAEIEAAGIRLMCMHMPIPFSPRRARHFARGLVEIFVVEEKQPNIESLMKDALYNERRRPRVTGKFDEHDAMLLPGHGGLTADDLLEPLRRRLSERIGHRLAPRAAAPRADPAEGGGGPHALLLLGMPPTTARPRSPTAPRWARGSAATR